MSYYPKKDIIISYSNESILFDCGKETKDCYSIITNYNHNIETDKIIYQSSVIKNWVYNEAPKDKPKVEGKKYRETVFTGTLKECNNYIDNIAKTQGYWDKHPTQSFEQLYIEPIL